MRDPYEVLGVPRDATAEDIRKAYRKRAAELHPDRHPGDAEKEREFKELGIANSVLSDPERRAMHDLSESFSGRGRGPGPSYDPVFGYGFGAGPGADAIAERLRRARSRTNGESWGRGRPVSQPGRDTEMSLDLTLEEVDSGATKTVSVQTGGDGICGTCNGSRAEPGSSCTPCNSCGGLSAMSGFGRLCHACDNHGDIPRRKCPACNGKGRVRSSRNVDVKVPFGISEGQRLRLAGLGQPGVGGPPGDLYMTVRIGDHPEFRRAGDNLLRTVEIDVATAMTEDSVPVRLLDGRTVAVAIPDEFVAGSTQVTVLDAGMRRSNGTRGAMVVTFHVRVRKARTEEARRLVREAAASHESRTRRT